MNHRIGFSMVVFTLLFAACAAELQHSPQKTSKGPLVWPQPPDQPRFAYETTLRSAADIVLESEEQSLRRRLTGVSSVSNLPAFDKPGGVVARNGRIYVADTGTETIAVFDVPRRRLFRLGMRDPGKLGKPSGLALDGQGNVYVSDAKLRQVMVYDGLGLFQHAIGSKVELERPSGVAASEDGERIYVVDRSHNESDNHRVIVYDKEGVKLREIGTRGSGEGQFNIPLQAAVAPDGTLYVLDAGNFRVQAFDREGNFLRSFGRAGINLGGFSRPRGIAVDGEGNVYVSDAGFNNFQIFTSAGGLLLAIGETGLNSRPGQFGLASGIAVDETGRVYVVDQLLNEVKVFRRLSDEEGRGMLAGGR